MEDLSLSSLEAANNNKGDEITTVEEEALLMEKPRQDWWEVMGESVAVFVLTKLPQKGRRYLNTWRLTD